MTRVRVAVIEQATGLNLERLAKAADSGGSDEEFLDAAVRDLMRRLYIDEDQARLAVLAGVMVGRLTSALKSAEATRRPPHRPP